MKYKVQTALSHYSCGLDITVIAQEIDATGKTVEVATLKDTVRYSWSGWFGFDVWKSEKSFHRRCNESIDRMITEAKIMIRVRDQLNSTDGLSRISRKQRKL